MAIQISFAVLHTSTVEMISSLIQLKAKKIAFLSDFTAGNQTNKNTGIKDNIDAILAQQYILLPLLYDSPQSSKNAVVDDAGKKTNEEPANEGEKNGQEKEGGASNKEDDQNVQDFRAELDNLLDTTDLLNTGIFSGAYDDEDVGAKADLNNLETTMNVCSFMLCDLDFEPLSLSLSSMPSCDLMSLTNMLILLHYLESFKSELAEVFVFKS
ncbi:hypothetical protein Tco_0722542 [Tanacetum coccineum]